MEGNPHAPENASGQRKVEKEPPDTRKTGAPGTGKPKISNINNLQNAINTVISHENNNFTPQTTTTILTPAPHVDAPNPVATQHSSTNIESVFPTPTQITVNTDDVRVVVNKYIESK